MEELPPYLSCVLPPSARRMCQSKGPKLLERDILGNDVPGCGSHLAVLSCRAARVVPPLGCG